MMQMKSLVPAITILACTLLLSQGVRAQTYEQAREIAAQADAAYAAGNPERARRLLVAGVRRCADDDERRCRLLMYYSLGYLEQRLGADDAAQRSMHLERAESYYRRVIEMEPGHGPTLNNLALVFAGLGASEEGISLLTRAAAADSRRAADYLVLLGDLQAENRAFDAAIEAYKQAATKRPGWNTPLRRTISVYGMLPAERMPEFFERCSGWAASAPDIALQGYELIIRSVYEVQRGLAERALLAWIELAADHDRLNSRALDALPAESKEAAVVELRSFVNSPDTTTPWWTRDNRRRQALATAAAALGRNASLRGDVSAAIDYWRAGYDRAPEVTAYLYEDLVGARIVRLDLATDLAALAVRSTDADDQFDFRRLERELYQGKADVYRANNLEAIQRFHTVLGRIYSDRNIWTSEVRYRNGIFQLSNALRTAAIREERTGYYQPLPDLKQRLAEGYLTLQTVESKGEARKRYIDAAQAFLDTDELGKSDEMLVAARRLRPDRDQEKAVDQLQQILTARQAQVLREVAGNAAASRTPDVRANWLDASAVVAARPSEYTSARAPFLYPGATNVLDESFLARQRFKLMADEAGATNPTAASEALITALNNAVTLIGAADLNRLGKAQEVVLTNLGPNETKSAYRMLGAATTSKSSNLNVALPGLSSPSVAVIDADSMVAARIGATPTFNWGADRPQITFDDGNVIIDANKGPATGEWFDEIKKYEDVAIILRD